MGPSQALDRGTRHEFEAQFGADFSDVRIHAGAQATGLTREFEARAMTLGTHIAFDAGEYNPRTSAGRRLLAHELAHVVQQRGAAGGAGPGASALEADADRAASSVAHGGAPRVEQRSPALLAFERRRNRESPSAGRSGDAVVSEADTEARLQRDVARLRPDMPSAINIFGMMTFDSSFYGASGLFNFRGRVMRGWEVNYYFVSMAMAHQGYSWGSAQDMIWAWNTAQYVLPGDPLMTEEMWFAARQGYDDEIARMPRPEPRPSRPEHPILGPPFCFAGEVRVLLADGRELEIRHVEPGARVLAVDEDSGRVRACEVRKRLVHPAGAVRVLRLANGRSLRITGNHPVYLGGRWVPAGEIEVGDRLTALTPDRRDLRGLRVESIDAVEPLVEALYDISVDGCHNFFAEGALVHNKNM